jgi:uracil-DNA glycosylase family 4
MRRLYPNSTFVAPKQGDGDRLVIGEAPGETEAVTGMPLTGGAGDWFNAMLPKAGIKRSELTILGCTQCRPPDDIFPTDNDAKYISKQEAYQAVEHCKQAHVLPILKERKWKRVDLLGAQALRFYTGQYSIHKHRGCPTKLTDVPELGYVAMPTMHPVSIMKDQTMLPVVINDLRKDLTIPPEYYNLYPDIDTVKAFKAKVFAFDIETPAYRELGDDAPITIVGLSDSLNRALVVPFTGAYIDELRRIFGNATEAIGHNAIQFDIPRLARDGVNVRPECVLWDTMLMHHLRFPNLGGEDKTAGGHDLGFVGSQFTNKPAWKDDKVNFELYCARDVDVTFQVFQQLKPLLEQHNLLNLYLKIQVPLAKICHLMHETGFAIDPGQIEGVRQKLSGEMSQHEKLLPEDLRSRTKLVNKRYPAPAGTLSPKTGKPLKFLTRQEEEVARPWRSGELVARWLYEDLGLPVQKDLKTDEVTTGKIALAKLSRIAIKGHRFDCCEDKQCDKCKGKGKFTKEWPPEVAAAISALAKLRKINSLMTLFCKEEMLSAAKMHPGFNPHGTSSGRLSSSEPNLQNVPEHARYIYVPSKSGYSIVDVDYSQIESRLTAFLAKDTEKLLKLSDPKFSEHKWAAEVFFGIPQALVEKDNDKDAPYGKAKRIVHGSNYGMGAMKISRMYDMDFREVRGLLEKWRKANWKTHEWQEHTTDTARKQGYLTTAFGRKRWFYTQSAYTESLSFLPQSTAADIIFRAMIGLMYERIGTRIDALKGVVQIAKPLPKNANLLIQVHDSLVFECPNEEVNDTVKIIKEVMEQPWPELGGFHIPISVKVGPSWGLAEDYKIV